jgi:hypothetical protein
MESEQYANLSDGMNAMEFLARKLSGEEVSESEQTRRARTVNKEIRTAEQMEADRIKAEARAAATDKFLKNTGIAFGGWVGLGNNSSKNTYTTTDKDTGEEKTETTAAWHGGGSIELRYRFFGIQTGINVLSDYKAYTPPGEEDQYAQLTIIQVPVLARFTFRFGFGGEGEIGGQLVGFAGVGMNVAANTSDAISVDPAKVSFIGGGGAGWHGRNFGVLLGYQWNGDLGGGSITADGVSYDYKRSSHMGFLVVSYYVPFRRK